MAAAKHIFKMCVEHFNKTGAIIDKTPTEMAEEYDLWIADEWTQLGFIIVVCLDNKKLIDSFIKGNNKVLDTLIGKTIKLSNMTAEPDFIKEMIPQVIDRWFKTS